MNNVGARLLARIRLPHYVHDDEGVDGASLGERAGQAFQVRCWRLQLAEPRILLKPYRPSCVTLSPHSNANQSMFGKDMAGGAHQPSAGAMRGRGYRPSLPDPRKHIRSTGHASPGSMFPQKSAQAHSREPGRRTCRRPCQLDDGGRRRDDPRCRDRGPDPHLCQADFPGGWARLASHRNSHRQRPQLQRLCRRRAQYVHPRRHADGGQDAEPGDRRHRA